MLRPLSILLNKFKCPECNLYINKYRSLCSLNSAELTDEIKKKIEHKWQSAICKGTYDPSNNTKQKRYVLSMFPYPSGNLHLGHMRVYTIGDAMARYYRLKGDNVFQPIGFDAFGLPAENAALQRKIPAEEWTYTNIKTMKEQLKRCMFSFDWDYEITTCDPTYYKFTQYIFLLMYENGLVYQREALVNWDPIDETVLANEQVDEKGHSWRSGALVEKKILNQWFIKTTKFAHNLSTALDKSEFKEWRDIISLQKHWLGECDGASFTFSVVKDGKVLTNVSIWTRYPEFINDSTFLAVSEDSLINKIYGNSETKLDIELVNPFNSSHLPIVVCEDVDYDEGTDMKLINPDIDSVDEEFAAELDLCWRPTKDIAEDLVERERVCELAMKTGIGGYKVSSKLKDWPISRQRRWGTPIPLIHCKNCGNVPVPLEDLPVTLPGENIESWSQTQCPKCKGAATREKDTMDTFVDSSWYFLRYLDPNNQLIPYNQNVANYMMPVDLYVGGKEHATLHLYYARFLCHFLHSIGFLKQPEPFHRLLVQGMVMGKTYILKESGKYLKEEEVTYSNSSVHESSSGKPVKVIWEKMSKSKHNGIEPNQILDKYGIDTMRLFMLSEVSPTSNKHWKSENFPGVLNWQKRIWVLMQDFISSRISSKSSFNKKDSKFENDLWASRNYHIKNVSFNFSTTYQLSVAISSLQGFTNALKKFPKPNMALSPEFEKCMAAFIIMLGPIVPHFASELWDAFQRLPRKINLNSPDILWDKPLLEQRWPTLDENYNLQVVFLVNNAVKDICTVPYSDFKILEHDAAIKMAFASKKVMKFIGNCDVLNTTFSVNPDYEAHVNIQINHLQKYAPKKEESRSV